MNSNVNKALLDLVVKTANDLAKHHSDITLKLVSDDVDERFSLHGKNVDNVLDLLGDLDKTQDNFKTEISEIVTQLGDIETACKDFTVSVASEATKSFDNVRVDIDAIKSALVELSLIIDSNENINALADGLKELTAKHDNSDVLNNATLGGVSSDLVKLKELITGIKDNSNSNDNALIEHINIVDEKLSNAIGLVSDIVEAVDSETDQSIQKILLDMVDTDAKLSNLKADIVKSSDNIAELNKDVHAKFKHLSSNDDEIKESISSLKSDISITSTSVASVAENVEQSNENIAECDKKIKQVDDELSSGLSNTNEVVNKLDKSLLQYSDDLTKLAESNSLMLESVEAITTSLSEQFSELKNESFLSSDKIDTKFAEIKLALVESDIKRTDALKEIVQQHAVNIQKELDDNFKKYRRDIDDQVEVANKDIVTNVDKMLAADKQMLNRAKQWKSGVEYGQSVITRNLGGIWQAKRATSDEPNRVSDDWYCISSGIDKAVTIKDHSNGVETIIGIHDSLGNIHQLTIPVATIRYLKGVYQESDDYRHLDSIMKDGCRWVATKDDPAGIPGEDDADWQVLTMRGPKGMKGNTGERGPKGKTGETGEKGKSGGPGPVPEMDDILKALIDFESPEGSQAIRRARGHWKLGAKYLSGDVTNVGRGLFLALRDNDGTETPGSSTEDWLLLLEASTGSSCVHIDSFSKIYMIDTPLLDPPEDGVIEYSDKHLYFTEGQRVSLVGSNGIKIDSSTVENSAVETVVYSHLFSANFLHADKRILASFTGTFSADSASETLTLTFRLGGGAVHSIVINPTNGVDIAWRAIHEGTIRVDGVDGKFIDFSEFSESGVAPLFAAEPLPHDVDTTQEHLYEITATWGAAKPGNSFTCTQGDLTYKH